MSETLEIKVAADVAGAMAGFSQLHSKIDMLGTATAQASTAHQGLLGSITSMISPVDIVAGGVAALGAGLFDSIGKAGAFDQSMAAVRATMQPTGEQMDKLRGLALDLGMATDVGSVSAQDAADAIGVLGKAGISADAQLAGVTKSTLQLAAAAGPEFGVAKSAELAADSLNSFGLKAGDAKGVVDTLVGAANASSIGLEDLKYGLAASGAVAHTVGLSFQDTAEALAVLGANGLKGSDAGTSLKSALTHLQPSSKAATAEMKELGLITADGSNKFFDAAGHVKNLAGISETLKTALAGMTDQQKLAALQTMFGTDAIRAMSILSSAGAEGVNKMGAAMAQQGDAAKVAADMNNNFKGKMESLGGTIDTLKISIGSALTPALSFLADQANILVGGALSALPVVFSNIGTGIQNVVSFFTPFVTGIQSMVAANPAPYIIGIGAALGAALLPALVAAVPVVGAAALAFGGLVASMVVAAAPFIAVGAAVGLLVLAFQNNFLGLRDFVVPVWNEIVDTITAFWGDIQPDLQAAWTNIQSMVTTAMNTIVPLIMGGLTALKAGWDSNWGGIRTIIESVWGVISSTVKVAWDLLSGIISVGLKVLQGDWSGAWTVVKTTLNTVWEDMKTLLGSAITAVGTLITNFVPTLASKLGEWGGKFISWVKDDVLPKLPGALADIWNGITKWVGDTVPNIAREAGKIGAGIVDGIKSALSNAWQGLVDKLKGLVDMLPQAVKDILGIHSPSTVFAGIGADMIRGLAVGIGDTFPQVEIAMRGRVRDLTGYAPVGSGGTGSYTAAWVGTPGGPNKGDTHIHVHIDGEELSHALHTLLVIRNDS